jgi:hypothetical protein
VRRGYTEGMLRELCDQVGLICEDVDYRNGIVAQKVTGLRRKLSEVNHLAAWAVTLPLRVLPPLLDRPLTKALEWPCYSICIEAYKPRFANRTASATAR